MLLPKNDLNSSPYSSIKLAEPDTILLSQEYISCNSEQRVILLSSPSYSIYLWIAYKVLATALLLSLMCLEHSITSLY